MFIAPIAGFDIMLEVDPVSWEGRLSKEAFLVEIESLPYSPEGITWGGDVPPILLFFFIPVDKKFPLH